MFAFRHWLPDNPSGVMLVKSHLNSFLNSTFISATLKSLYIIAVPSILHYWFGIYKNWALRNWKLSWISNELIFHFFWFLVSFYVKLCHLGVILAELYHAGCHCPSFFFRTTWVCSPSQSVVGSNLAASENLRGTTKRTVTTLPAFRPGPG